MKRPILTALLPLLACLFLNPAHSAEITPPKGMARVTSVEGMTEYRLDNGLKVLLFPDPGKPTMTVNMTYLVGSRHEGYGETGMAHLLEHLLFKGTPKFPNIDAGFNQRGMRSNGSTTMDRTNYFELFEASEANLRWALEMEADRMVNSFVARKDLDTEMTVVRNEYERGENEPAGVLIKRLQSVAYDWHNYGNSTIGNRSDIENVGIENLRAFYRRYYQPDNAVLLIAGKFDEARALQLVTRTFGPIPKPKRVLPTLWTAEPTQDGERSVTVRRKGDIQWVTVAYKVPSALHTDANALSFANFVLTNAPSGRLHKALVETGKAAEVFGETLSGVDTGLLIIGAAIKKDDPIAPVQEEMLRIVEAFYQNPPSKEEMERARKSFANDVEQTLNNHEALGIQLSEYIAIGDWRLFFLSRDRDEKMTADEATQATQRYFRRDNRTVGIFQPEDAAQRAEIPAAPVLSALVKDYKGKPITSTAEAFDPSQTNIDKRTQHYQAGGVKIALLNKKNRGETVNIALTLHLGDEKSLFGKRTISQLAGAMLNRGTTRYTREQLADEFDKLKAAGGVGGTSAQVQTTREFLPDVIKLIVHVLKEPAFPESEFVQLKKQTLTAIEAQMSDPNAKASERLGQLFDIYPKGDWRGSSTFAESIAEINRITLDDLKAFHRNYYGASAAQISVVGDFDVPTIRKLIEQELSTWQATQSHQPILSEYKAIPATNESIETPDKENAAFFARLNIDMRDDDPDYPALYLANYIIGGDADLNARLADRIRQREGLSYTVRSGLNVDALDRAASWNVFAIAAPQNIAKVEAAFKDEMAQIINKGFNSAEVSSAISGALQKRTQTRAQDSSLAAAWVGLLYTNRTFAYSKDFEDKLRALKPADLNRVVKKYLDPAQMSIIKAGDFKKAGG